MSVWSTRITADGAFWGIVVGFLGNLVPKILTVFDVIYLPVYLDPFVIGIILSFFTTIIVLSRGNVTAEEHRYRLHVHETPLAEFDPAMTSKTLWFAKGLVICGAALTVLMIVFYVLPYQGALEHALDTLRLAQWWCL